MPSLRPTLPREPWPRDLWHGRLFRWLAATLGALAALTLLVPTPALVVLTNGAALALCAGASIAFAPSCWIALRQPRPNASDYLAFGIFFGMLSSGLLRIVTLWTASLHWAAFGELWLVPVLFGLQCVAAYAHQLSPACLGGAPPSGHWRRCGIAVGAVVLVACLLVQVGRR